jgi:hypothetical protein
MYQSCGKQLEWMCAGREKSFCSKRVDNFEKLEEEEEEGEGDIQGCQIFLCITYQNGETYQIISKCAKRQQNIPNGNKIYQMATK